MGTIYELTINYEKMPSITTATQTAMIVGWGVPEQGRFWFNSDTAKFMGWDGTALKTMS
jgi:hypothetical protein